MMKTPPRFSLVEGLILFVVIGLLLSFAPPLLQRAAETADLAKCRSNLHELGVASHFYASEHGGRFPGNYTSWGTAENLWGTYIADRMYSILLTPEKGGRGTADYLGSAAPLICPSLAPEVYETAAGYRRPEAINEDNPIMRMGYAFTFVPSSDRYERANDLVYSNPNQPLCFDFGWTHGPSHLGLNIPSHPGVMNVLHVGGHVTVFSLDEANEVPPNSLLLHDALRENASSN